MKSKLGALLVAAVMVVQVGASAFADDNMGPWTKDHPYAWGVTSFPLRVVTGGLGMGVGAITGGAKGIIETEQKFAEKTFGEADKNPLMVPVGILGAVVAAPVGLVVGAPKGALETGKEGYDWWNRF